ncbi:MAG: Cytochrome oxidase biosis protein Sco1/SenC/PrrC, putative copper metallochaperone [Myxococcaceae bacterium]|nr:Cytochrome oxidase biosis protein Sco1/SenC/PrrC, putative copper metallochaperone [Myxococcaceae bacterium]
MYEQPVLPRLALCLLLLTACAKREPLPVLASVPAFELTSQAGVPWASRTLDGKVWVANFVFTRCPTICPTFTAKMASIQQKTPDEVRLVSFTVDPEFDTPEKLAEYATKFHATGRWTFLTGEGAALEAVVVKGMMQPMVKGDGSLMSIGHGSYFVLIDGKQQIRGFYRFNDDDSVEQVVRDARALLAGG